MLAHCQRGVYADNRMKGINAERKAQWFQRHPEGWEVAPRLRQALSIKRLNLANPPFPMKGPMDLVICRNVMIYFDNAIRQALINEVHRLLRPGGFFLVGHAESLTGLTSKFKNLQPSVYQKV